MEIPTAEMCEQAYQSMKDSGWDVGFRDGCGMPMPPTQEDVINHYVALRMMGFSKEQVVSGHYDMGSAGLGEESTTDVV